jgi:hypothetical protein
MRPQITEQRMAIHKYRAEVFKLTKEEISDIENVVVKTSEELGLPSF